MDFGSNSVLERVAFGLKCVLYRVRVLKCRPSRIIQNLAERPPGGKVVCSEIGICDPSEEKKDRLLLKCRYI